MTESGDRLRARRDWNGLWRALPVAILLITHFVLTLAAASSKSPAYDEVAHLTAGYSYWAQHDFRLQPENGILPQRWMSLPVFLSGTFRFPELTQATWSQSDVWTLGDLFFHGLGNSLAQMLFQGRAAVALAGVALCLLVYLWSQELFGSAGGLLSLTLCALSPTLLAQSGLMTSDTITSLFFLLSVKSVWRNLHVVSPRNVALGCLAVGGLFLSKFSAALIIPMTALMVWAQLRSLRPIQVVDWRGNRHDVSSRTQKLLLFGSVASAYALGAWGLIWGCYEFRYCAFSGTDIPQPQFFKHRTLTECSSRLGTAGTVLRWLGAQHLLPESYLYGAAFVLRHAKRYAFWNGMHSIDGWRMFFPYCFLVKTPLPVLGIAGGTLVSTVWTALSRRRIPETWYHTVPLWSLIGVYGVTSIFSTLNIGQRHLLPIYPAMFVLCGGAAKWWRSAGPSSRWLLMFLLSAFVVESGRAYPHYLAYFNQITQQKEAYKHLVDSSLDWGQDLPALKAWLDRNGWDGSEARPVHLIYFGTGSPRYYGIQAVLQPRDKVPESYELRPGLYCISATSLQCVYPPARGHWTRKHEADYQAQRRHVDAKTNSDAPQPEADKHARYALSLGRLLAWLRQREPLDSAGFSILLYEVSEQDLQAALDGRPPELYP